MAKTGISIYFTTSAPGYKDRLAVCATDDSGKRKYMRVEGIDQMDTEKWDKRLQMFTPDSKGCLHNNAVIMETRISLEVLIRTGEAKNAEHLFALYRERQKHPEAQPTVTQHKKAAPEEGETLGRYLSDMVDRMKSEGFSRNYELFQTLLHTLMGKSMKCSKKGQRRFTPAKLNGTSLYDCLLVDIANPHLTAFADWIKTEKKGKNYRNLTVCLMGTLRRAQNEGKNKNDLTFSFTKNAPKQIFRSLSGTSQLNRKHALNQHQIEEVFSFDVTTIQSRGQHNLYWNQLCLDATKLMYLLMSRPADVVSMTWDMVVTQGDVRFLCYIPFKKRGLPDPQRHIVRTPISAEALEIMLKYKGRSKTNAILPFKVNDKTYRIDTPDGMRVWSLELTKSIRKIDIFLKHVGKALKLDWTLSLYAFRRSAITHNLEAGQNVLKVAKRAGTGLMMIDKHYYQDQGGL